MNEHDLKISIILTKRIQKKSSFASCNHDHDMKVPKVYSPRIDLVFLHFIIETMQHVVQLSRQRSWRTLQLRYYMSRLQYLKSITSCQVL